VDLSRFRAKHYRPNPKIILSVGALEPIKRHALTIRAVSKIKDARLVIVGKGSLKDELLRLADDLMPNRLEILHLAQEDIYKIYHTASVFVYPTSPWESFGIVLLEAMASGLPVVTTDDPIRREIVGDAGLFVDPEDTDKFTNAISRALQTHWVSKPRKQAEKFSWDRIAHEYEKLFNSLHR
jgi:glycosyltransferase involved in cell wall biosynthesis